MKNFTSKLLFFIALALPAGLLAQVPKLTSLPGATATIYIDFDGEVVTSGYWNGGSTLNCASPGMTSTQITEIFNRVSEDYRPFNVSITTDLDTFNIKPLNRRVRIIVTPTSAWRTGVGGIAYTGSFTWSDDTPAFVFSDRLGNNPKYVAECVTHESGHTLGLSHQTKYDNSCNLLETYNTGTGSGETSWAPVMGNSYYKNMTGWNNGPTPSGCAVVQDNLTIITSQNGFTYRVDDYTETMNSSTTALSSSFVKDGIITTSTDKDAFKYVLSQGRAFHMDAVPYSVGANSGANLDVQIQLYNGNTLVRTFNPASALSVVIDTNLNAGTYYFVVSGVGNEYGSDYGSLGSYKLTGFLGALPIHDISLSGTVDKSTHNLSWNIIADEPIKTQVLEMSTDGVKFTPITSISTLFNKYGYTTNQNTTIFYRLKVTSIIEQTAYSNIVALKSTTGSGKRFTVSTFVQQDLTVNATESFQYRLSDANGRLIAGGTGQKGINRIDLANKPGGMYILQLINNNERQTERIIKQ
jgi:hypothetical protein